MGALLTAQFYSPSRLIMIDVDDTRLELAMKFGATEVINSAREGTVAGAGPVHFPHAAPLAMPVDSSRQQTMRAP